MTQHNISPQPIALWLRVAPGGINCPTFPVARALALPLPRAADALLLEGRESAGRCRKPPLKELSVSGPWVSIWARLSQWQCLLQALWFGYVRSIQIDCCALWIGPREREGFRQEHSQASVRKSKYSPQLGLLCFSLFPTCLEFYFIFFLLLFSWLPNLIGGYWLKWEMLQVQSIYIFW